MDNKQERYTDHPSMVVVGGCPHLRVLEDFFIEERLPKWLKIADREKDQITLHSSQESGNGSISDERSERLLLSDARFDRDGYLRRKKAAGEKSGGPWWMRLWPWRRRGQPVEKTFADVKDAMVRPTTEDLVRASKVVDAVETRLMASGQYEIAKRVASSRDVLAAETALVMSGRLRYISEEQIVKFMLMSERGVRVEYLRYYPNILPAPVAKEKVDADRLLVFDNYCVMYYDDGTSRFSLVKRALDDKEREKRRDPILFGMIKGSRKLYYVTDWVTDDDDLTLDRLERVIGEKAFDLGQDTFMGTEEQVARLLSRITLDTEDDLRRARANGLVISDEQFDNFILTGDGTPEVKAMMADLGIRPVGSDGAQSAADAAVGHDAQRDGTGRNRRRRRRRRGGKDK